MHWHSISSKGMRAHYTVCRAASETCALLLVQAKGERERAERFRCEGCKSNINSTPGKSPGSCKMHRGIVSTTISVAEDRERELARALNSVLWAWANTKRHTCCADRVAHTKEELPHAGWQVETNSGVLCLCPGDKHVREFASTPVTFLLFLSWRVNFPKIIEAEI
jgi:hypothetical protein